MQTTILDRWWPVTYDFGLIRSDTDTISVARSEMYRKTGTKTTKHWVEGPLENCFSGLEPLVPAPTKELFLATTFGWTAYFSNGCRGSDPFLPMLQLSKELGVTALRACRSHADALYQSVILEVYDAPQAGGDEYGYRRSIAAANDGGRWVFSQTGTPYDFEDLSKFTARLKRDRFTPEMLSFYLENMGIAAVSDGTLQPDGKSRGFMLSRQENHNLPRYTLEEAKNL